MSCEAMDRLTPTEREVLELVARGLADKQIAAELGIAASTAKAHVRTILIKLNAMNRTDAAVRWTRWTTAQPD